MCRKYCACLTSGGWICFSKSVQQLPEKEITWALRDQDYQEWRDPDGSLLYRYKSCIDSFPYWVERNGKRTKIHLPEKRVVTYSPQLAKKQKRELQKQIDKASRYCLCQAKRKQLGEAAKYVHFKAVDKEGRATDQDIAFELNWETIEKSMRLEGYNLIVSSEQNQSAAQLCRLYHQLWHIEASFRVMKTDLDARPVYLQKESTIKGHFLICYLAVLRLRLFEVEKINEQFSAEQILSFMRNFSALPTSARTFTNLSKNGPFIKFLARATGLPLTHYFLSSKEVNDILHYRF